MSNQEMLQELERLKAENAKLKAVKQSGLIVKRSDKSDGIMVLGLRKFPITFYADEWEALFANADKIRAVAKTESKAPMQAVG